MSLRTRITLFGLGIVALVLGVISALFLLLVVGGVPQTQDKELQARSATLADAVRGGPGGDLTPREPLAVTDVSTATEIVTLVLDDAGTVLDSTAVAGGRPLELPADLLAKARTDGTAVATVNANGVPLRIHVRTWLRDDGTKGFAAAAQTLRRKQETARGVIAAALIAGIAALIASTVGIWLVAGRALRPLRQLTAMADEIGRSADLSRRLPEARHRDDLGRLTASFNAMMGRLQDAYRRVSEALAAQQRFTADASHELRTPLTTVRGSAGFLRTHADANEADRSEALADIESESARMTRLVDDLLTLARADGGHRLRRSPVDLGDLAQQVCRQAKARQAECELHCAGAPVVVDGDEDALRRLLWILVDNAVAHASANVWVAVTRHDDRVTLHVSDDGPGIPPGLHERIFDRFFRADESRRSGGAGLGLSIARWIVHEHGGRITATGNDRGGASFIAELPASDASSPTVPISNAPSSNA